ncbi:MAG: NAD(P)H-dependent oxidoreductase subunit E [Spirochaetaceae bacterium]|nr:NAD(P)H-dependent oxidoreductase subunit E [Spirochaetaceae bacterium]
MKKIKVSICTGTTCYVMGASDLLLLEEVLPEHLKGKVEIEGVTCLEKCKSTGIGKNKAPFVMVDDELVPSATVQTVIAKIEEKNA